MAKITRITTQKKANQRYNIFLSDENQGEHYGFSVDESVLINFQLRKGMEISDAMAATIKKSDSMYQSYTLAINYLSFRMRTKKEMLDYLTEKEVDPNHISSVMGRLVNEGLLDDRQFAEMFVRSRINTSSKGPAMIKQELMNKGVEANVADEALKQFSFALQYDKVEGLVEKKLQQKKKQSFQKQLQNVQALLQQKGYTKDVIQAVFHEIPCAKDDHAEWEAIIYHGEKLRKKHTLKRSGFELKQKIKEGLYRKGFSLDLIQQYIESCLEKKK
ncbi:MULTISPECIES: recombination regulator RecX [Clostridia]|uniref:recombination regulator RecX n=1 Tax=Clostridia TaxID=186801 RepID=UPI000EA40AFD|nr:MULTISPECIES: recombination regulator RecX [Clostridia]NBJ70116.1 recombination regulator RecX [Roseburia sp. 1XD42-34]RKI77073.1 recombination regulator RecX [Clostridium sp. 1xD42-85]